MKVRWGASIFEIFYGGDFLVRLEFMKERLKNNP